MVVLYFWLILTSNVMLINVYVSNIMFSQIFFINTFICRAKRWVINCRNQNIDKENLERLNKTRVVCSMHFESHYYYNPQDKANSSLYSHAIPTIINVPNPPKRTEVRRPLPTKRKLEADHTDVIETLLPTLICRPSTSRDIRAMRTCDIQRGDDNQRPSGKVDVHSGDLNTNTKEKNKESEKHECYWKRRCEILKRKNLRLYGENNRLKHKIKKIEEKGQRMPDSSAANVLEIKRDSLPTEVLQFFETQIRYFSRRKRGMRWTDDEIRFAMAIHYASTVAYCHLRQTFGLPSVTVLYRSITMCLSDSGICRQTIEGMRVKFLSALPQEKLCSITFDGMKISQSLKLCTNDSISGYVETGYGQRSNYVSTEMLVFMAHGISTKWKQVSFS